MHAKKYFIMYWSAFDELKEEQEVMYAINVIFVILNNAYRNVYLTVRKSGYFFNITFTNIYTCSFNRPFKDNHIVDVALGENKFDTPTYGFIHLWYIHNFKLCQVFTSDRLCKSGRSNLWEVVLLSYTVKICWKIIYLKIKKEVKSWAKSPLGKLELLSAALTKFL